MGTSNQYKTAKKLFSKPDSSGTTDRANWAKVEQLAIIDLICAVSHKGGAVRFGYSRDRGAFSLGVYLGDDRDTIWIRPSEDPDAVIRDIITQLEDLPDATQKAPKKR